MNPPETNTSSDQNNFSLPAGWLRGTTYVAFVWGLGLGTYESLTGKSVAVLGFSGGLILLGMGLRAAASRVFHR